MPSITNTILYECNLVTLKFLIVTPIDISQDILGLKKIDKPNESVKIKKCVKVFVAPFKKKMSTKVFIKKSKNYNQLYYKNKA